MKPVLQGITIEDIDLYKSTIKKYGIKDVIVGSIFGWKNGETVHFSDKAQLFYNAVSDESKIRRSLMSLGNVRVFTRSSQVVNYYKDREKEISE